MAPHGSSRLRGLARLRLYDAVLEGRRRFVRKARTKAEPLPRLDGQEEREEQASALRELLTAAQPLLGGDSWEGLVRTLATARRQQGATGALSEPWRRGGDNDSVRRLEQALRRCPNCRRGKVRVLRLRSAEDLTIV
eukprot:TRINITY_DN104540_c0_g1_i1.p1 TRINITY_DN104540_c0_g1~~TRINITY_DN104540_c0_g1_i1.p1  ORF type:complete len:145 (+),score=15.55 TRINITY_DN104540_c0_g1_i1:25-435(+)